MHVLKNWWYPLYIFSLFNLPPKDILINIQMSKFLILFLAVLTLASAGCSCYKKKPFLGYDFTIAKVAAQYASCSCVTNEYINNIQSWFYDPCR